ncbi:hypothetical protein GOBAR_DD12585 [Gossypium barbadense]|nr:hypothetical protein GOBAR_DD12585 [Gossypium barbadense]
MQQKDRKSSILLWGSGVLCSFGEIRLNGNLHHDPTINPGLGFARCPRCLSLLNPDSDKAEWTITSVLEDATAVVHFLVAEALAATSSSFRTVLSNFLVVKTVEGVTDLQIPPGTQPRDVLVLARKGAPKLNKPSIRGDHIFTIKVNIPNRIREGKQGSSFP